MPLPPSLSPEQRAAALEKAAEARKARAELKKRLQMGHLTLAEVFEQSPGSDTIGKMKIRAVLESLPNVGKVTARRKMEEIGISDTRRVRGVGAQQQKALLEAFPAES